MNTFVFFENEGTCFLITLKCLGRTDLPTKGFLAVQAEEGYSHTCPIEFHYPHPRFGRITFLVMLKGASKFTRTTPGTKI
jgi:hypothetical protein